MTNKVNITNTDNKVTITPQSNTSISTSTTNTPVTVTQGTTSIVTLNTPGPVGPQGNPGESPGFASDIEVRNITASGTISSTNLLNSGILFPVNGIITSSINLQFVGNTLITTDIVSAGDIASAGKITAASLTASGDISASSDIIGKDIFGQTLFTDFGLFLRNSSLSDLAIQNETNTTGFIRFLTKRENAQVERLRISNNGNVGIGTSSPGEKLTVLGNISASGDISASQMLLERSGSVNLTLNSTQNGQSSRINLREDGNTFGAYMDYDSSDFHIGSIDGGVDTNSIVIARGGDVTFNHNVQIGNQKTLTVLLDNDRTTPSFTVQDENNATNVFSISGNGSNNSIASLVLTGSINVVPSSSVGGNITASGDISASSNISASGLHIKGSGRNEIRGNDGFRLVGGWNVGAEDLRYLNLDGTTLQYRTNGDAIFEIRSQNSSNNDTYIHFEHASDPGPRNISVGVCQDSGSFIIARDEGFADNNDFTITGSNGFIGINEPNPTERLTVNGNISGSGTGSFQYLRLDYDNIPTSDPSIKGVVYRNGSNQLFISPGS